MLNLLVFAGGFLIGFGVGVAFASRKREEPVYLDWESCDVDYDQAGDDGEWVELLPSDVLIELGKAAFADIDERIERYEWGNV
jgi:hypothetical protein